MSMDLEVIELLPAREELAFLNLANVTIIGFIAQGNANTQVGGVNLNYQSNSVNINS